MCCRTCLPFSKEFDVLKDAGAGCGESLSAAGRGGGVCQPLRVHGSGYNLKKGFQILVEFRRPFCRESYIKYNAPTRVWLAWQRGVHGPVREVLTALRCWTFDQTSKRHSSLGDIPGPANGTTLAARDCDTSGAVLATTYMYILRDDSQSAIGMSAGLERRQLQLPA